MSEQNEREAAERQTLMNELTDLAINGAQSAEIKGGTGAGTLTLPPTNTYRGTTTVNEGTLR